MKDVKKTLLSTLTGEAYMPIRLYYRVKHEKILMTKLERLKCMQYDEASQQWVWLYSKEAESIDLPTSAKAVPKEYRPVVLGRFGFQDDLMFLDLHSIERTLAALKFFDDKVPRRAAEVIHLRIVNKLFSAETDDANETSVHPGLNHFFDDDSRVDIISENSLEEKIEAIKAKYEDKAKQIEAVNIFLERESNKPFSEIEQIPIYFYEEGLTRAQMMLQMHQLVAFEHWKGNTDFTQADAVQKAFGLDTPRSGDILNM